jgi:hypothetical protein
MERRFSATYTERMNTTDAGRPIGWGQTSIDYAPRRPGPSPSFCAKLAAFGVGRRGQWAACAVNGANSQAVTGVNSTNTKATSAGSAWM